MLRQIRILLRENKFLNRTIYGLVRWFANDVLKYRCRILHHYGYEAVALVTEISARLGVACYADYGTLLGFIRDHGFIKHDDDMDFSVLPPHDKTAQFYKELVANGFIFERYLVIDGRLKEFSMRYKEISIDFFLNVLSKDGKFNDFIDEPNGDYWTHYSYIAPTKLVKYNVRGIEAIIPENYNDVLTSEYGNWNEVIKLWNSKMISEVGKDYSQHEQLTIRDINEWEKLMGLK